MVSGNEESNEKKLEPKEYKQLCEQLNREASLAKEDSYLDPKNGQFVSTSYYLQHLRKCCKGGCRHCPFGFKKR